MSPSHQQQIAQAFEAKPGMIAAVEHVAGCAEAFYTHYIAASGISKAQIAAVGAHLRRSPSLREAKIDCMEFLGHQMDKLEKREDKGANALSWCRKIEIENRQRGIGDHLIECIEYDWYLPKGAKPSLSLLQRFWHQIETLYHYHAVTRQKAGIHKEVCRS